jgi:hypothetical protein
VREPTRVKASPIETVDFPNLMVAVPLRASLTQAILSGMPHRKSRDDKPASSEAEIIAKAEHRFAKADKQHARIKADPKREVAREQLRVQRTKKKPGA